METPAILKGEVHLPLMEGTLSSEAVSMANMFYQTSLNAGDFKQSQAFRAADGKLYLELINVNTKEVIVTFTNKAEAAKAADTELVIGNVLSFASDEYSWLTSPVAVHSANELEFLDEVGVGNTYPTENTDNTVAWKLSTLLNSYRVVGQWKSGTIGDLCTGGFKLVYKGTADKAPEEFLLSSSDMVAVVQILHGSKLGFICLRV
jgi:hypothetical protein